MDQAKQAGFLGQGWAFPPSFNAQTGKAHMVTSTDDIEQSLHILLLTRPGERLMEPEFGCRIQDFVFAPTDGETASGIEVAVEEAILFYEPRITLNAVIADLSDWPDGRLNLSLDYSIDGTNIRSNKVFPFYLTEGTLVRDGGEGS